MALLLKVLDVPLPEFKYARAESAELGEAVPAERRADLVVAFRDNDGEPVRAVVVEVQNRYDHEKYWTWPQYMINLRARLKCPVMLIVFTPDPAEAERCAVAIHIGHPGWVLYPLVVSFRKIPIVENLKQARETPTLAVLSAMAHGEENYKVLDAMFAGLLDNDFDEDTRAMYFDLVGRMLPKKAQEHLKELRMSGEYRYQSDFALEFVQQGEAKGEAKAVLKFLAARGIEVPDHVRDRVMECTDLAQLEIWIGRATAVESAEALFD